MNPSSPQIPPHRLARFLQALLPLEVAIDEAMVSRLHRYISRQLDGEPYRSHDPDLALLLDRDPDLAEAYAVLYELEEAARTDGLASSPQIPSPDLSFLTAGTLSAVVGDSLGWLERRGRTIVVRFSQALLETMQPPPAAVGLRQGVGGRYGERLATIDGLALAEPQPFTINVYADREQRDVVLLEVELSPPGRSWPNLDGLTVTLRAGEIEQTILTDPWGMAVFEDFPRSELPNVAVTIKLSEFDSNG